jgi:hypothetical protein
MGASTMPIMQRVHWPTSKPQLAELRISDRRRLRDGKSGGVWRPSITDTGITRANYLSTTIYLFDFVARLGGH